MKHLNRSQPQQLNSVFGMVRRYPWVTTYPNATYSSQEISNWILV